MRRLVFAAMLAAAAFGAVSCGGRGSDGKNGKDSGQETEFVSAEISLAYKASEDVLEIADISVEYTDAQGTVHSESDISGTWSLKTVADEFPAMVCFKPVFTLREGNVSADETYRLDAWRFRSKGPQKTDDYFGVKPPKKDPIINKKGRELGSRASIFRSIATQLS